MDNCSTMRGVRGGVETLIRQKNHHLLDVSGDTVHMMNNVAKTLLRNVDDMVQNICSDIYYDIEESPKVKEIFHEIQTLMNAKTAKHLIRPISSRFLQMLDVTTRLLEVNDFVTIYYAGFVTEEEKTRHRTLIDQIFKQHNVSEEAQAAISLLQMAQHQQQKSATSQDRKDRIISSLFLNRTETVTKLSLFRGLLSEFQGYVKEFQAESPQIHTLHRQMIQTTSKVLAMFIKPEHIPDKAKKMVKLDINDRGIQKADKHLTVGKCASAHLNKARVDKTQQYWVANLYENLRKGFVMAGSKLLQLPISNKTLRRLSVLDPAFFKQASHCFQALARSLPNVISEEEGGELAMELNSFSVDLQVKALADAFEEEPKRVDTCFWTKVFQLKTFDRPRYPLISKLASSLLTIFSGPLVESTFNIMDDIVEKDRTKLTVENYEAVAIVKTTLKRKKVKATEMKVNSAMKRSCIHAYDSYQKHLRRKKEMEDQKRQQKLETSIQLLKKEKAKRLATLIKLKDRITDKGKRKRTSDDGSACSGRRWKRIKIN